VTVLRIPHIARLIENWRKHVFFNQAEELRREFCGLRFCGFWKDQRKIGAVRESEADLKYYDAADDEGEVQCDIPVSPFFFPCVLSEFKKPEGKGSSAKDVLANDLIEANAVMKLQKASMDLSIVKKLTRIMSLHRKGDCRVKMK
jgi:hypothetical protein